MAEASVAGGGPRVRTSARPVEVAVDELVRALRDVLAGQERVRLAIPGGSALEALPGARARLAADWSRVVLTWTDERCVPSVHADSNRGAAERLGLLAPLADRDSRPGPAAVLPLFEDDESPAQAVERVEAAVASQLDGALDVVLLGLGEDGHVASLFPGRPEPRGRWAAHVDDSPKPPADRITLTRRLLESARHGVLLAMGEAKRDALERLVGGDPRAPAHGLLPRLVIVTDLPLGVAVDVGDAPGRAAARAGAAGHEADHESRGDASEEGSG